MVNLGGVDLGGLLNAVGQGATDLIGGFKPETQNPALQGLGAAGRTDLWAGLQYGQNPALAGLGNGGGGNPALAGLGNAGWGGYGTTGGDLAGSIGNNPLWQGAERSRLAWQQQQADQQARQQATQQGPQAGATSASGGPYGAHEQYRASIVKYAAQSGIDPDALAAILQIEVPSGDPHATSPVGARGLGQIMPGTWAGLADPGDDPYDADASIKNAAKYYASLYKQFGDYGLAAAAYQGGPGAIVNGRARNDINDGNLTPEGYAQRWAQNYQGIKQAAPKATQAGDWNGAIQKAQQYRGLAYTNEGIRVTGNPADGFDCSSLVGWAFGLDRNLWNAQAQADATQRIDAGQLQAGDLIFFQGTNPNDPSARPVSHVGIYLGNGKMLNAQNDGVQEADLGSPYWQSHLYSYGRITPAMRAAQGGDNTGQK